MTGPGPNSTVSSFPLCFPFWFPSSDLSAHREFFHHRLTCFFSFAFKSHYIISQNRKFPNLGNSIPVLSLRQPLKRLGQVKMKKSRYSKKYTRLLRTLRQVRKSAGLTQAEVGKRFGTHASFVSKCESGERRIDVVELAEFCRLYKVTLSEFLKMSEIE